MEATFNTASSTTRNDRYVLRSRHISLKSKIMCLIVVSGLRGLRRSHILEAAINAVAFLAYFQANTGLNIHGIIIVEWGGKNWKSSPTCLMLHMKKQSGARIDDVWFQPQIECCLSVGRQLYPSHLAPACRRDTTSRRGNRRSTMIRKRRPHHRGPTRHMHTQWGIPTPDEKQCTTLRTQAGQTMPSKTTRDRLKPTPYSRNAEV